MCDDYKNFMPQLYEGKARKQLSTPSKHTRQPSTTPATARAWLAWHNYMQQSIHCWTWWHSPVEVISHTKWLISEQTSLLTHLPDPGPLQRRDKQNDWPCSADRLDQSLNPLKGLPSAQAQPVLGLRVSPPGDEAGTAHLTWPVQNMSEDWRHNCTTDQTIYITNLHA